MTEQQLNPFQHIKLEHLAPSPTNPRKTFAEADLADLAASIEKQGVMQPILARLWPDDYPTPEGRADRPLYEIIAGERRYRASLLAGLDEIPVLIRQLNTRQVLEAQIVENLQRRDVSELEEAEGYDLMMREHGYTADELAAKVGKSRAYIYGRLKLCALCEEARQAYREGKLDASRALLIARIPGATLQTKALKEITEGWQGVMPYRSAAQYIQNHYMRGLRHVIFALGDATLHPEAGPCTTCPKRPCNTPELYPDVPEDRAADVCTDTECMTAKTDAYLQRQANEAAASGRQVVRGLSWSEFGSDFVQLNAEDPDLPETIPQDEDGNDLPDTPIDEAEHARAPTVAEMLQLTGAQLEIVLVEHPSTHQLVECVREADYRQAVPAPVVPERAAARAHTDARAQHEAACQAEAARRRELFTAIRAHFSNGGIASTHAALRTIAQQFWAARYTYQRHQGAAKLNNITPDQNGGIAGWLAEASPADLITLMLDLALEPATDVPVWATDITTPAPLLDMARALGIDPDNPSAAPIAAPETASTPEQAPPGGEDSARKERRAELAAKGIKYCHPTNDYLAWSGRGQKPKWVAEWLANGGTLEQLSTATQAAPAADATAETPSDKPAAPAKKAARATAAKSKGKAATAAKKPKEKAKTSGRAAAGGKKSTPDEPPAYRCPNTPDMLEGAAA